MGRGPMLLVVDADARPRFAAIARAVVHEIRRGRSRPGDQLPGTRELAATLGVHRNTVVAAYRDLEGQGWIESRAGTGTFVADVMPQLRARAPTKPRAAVAFDVPPALLATPQPRPSQPKASAPTILLDSGLPDPRLLPAAIIARAFRRVMSRPSALADGDPRGHSALREAVARSLSHTRAIPCTADEVLVTRGSQQAIDLVARALVRSGDVVVVEQLGYRPAWDALRLAGATLVGVPVDRDGLDTDALARVVAQRRVRLVYVTPHHQYPTLATLSAPRRLALLDLARRHRFAVLEDDYDHEFRYDHAPVAPVRSLDEHGSVLYVGTLSKVLAPGLRTGWLIAPPSLVTTITRIRRAADRQGDLPLEAALADLFEDDTIGRHVRRMRRIHLERRDAAVASLRRHLGDTVTLDVPRGGMALWLSVDPKVDPDAWAAAARLRGVAVAPGSAFALDGARQPNLRIGYCRHTPRELDRGIMVLAQTRRAAQRRRA